MAGNTKIDEYNIFLRLAVHYGFNRMQQRIFAEIARFYSAEKQSKRNSHIRNPEPHQWKSHLPDNVLKEFYKRYDGLVEALGY